MLQPVVLEKDGMPGICEALKGVGKRGVRRVNRLATLSHAGQAFRSPAAIRFMDRLFSTPRLAHHPDCACYDAHVLRFGQFVLCLGCTCMAAGAAAAAVTLIAGWLLGGFSRGWPATPTMGVVGLALYAPTLIQPFCQRKPFKVLARFLLGAAVIVLGTAGLILPPLDAVGLVVRVGFMAAFWIVFKATLRQRARFTPDPCARCRPTVYPFCEGNRQRVAGLLEELRRSAGPDDAEFVAFAAALAGDPASGATVEVTSLHALARPEARACHRA